MSEMVRLIDSGRVGRGSEGGSEGGKGRREGRREGGREGGRKKIKQEGG